ncbi:MAG TPA: AarF/ABC1/UbiB kinase family protein [Ktedonobacterales bacterium]
MRIAIEELGPTFIKLGQILSTRGDLLPEGYRAELAKLQDAAQPVPAEQVASVLAEELGCPVEEAFLSFEMTPLAAASIGQAHAATLADGTEVVVKVRRPGVVEQIEEDLHILVDLAVKASRHWEVARFYDLLAIAQEFAQTLRSELDYLSEASNLERIADNFAEEPDIHIPKVFWETTTSRVLTIERIRGIKISDVASLDAAGLNRSEVAHRAARLLLTMILEHGFFHADPHAGNVFVEPSGRIGLIDFGMVGEVDSTARDLLVRLVVAIVRKDAGLLADVMLELGVAQPHVDRNALRRDMQRLLARYSDRKLGEVKLGLMLSELLDVLRWHHLRLAPDLALLVKTIVMGEGLGAEVDPTFNLMDVYAPMAEDLMRQRFSQGEWLKQLLLASVDSLQMGLELPRQVHRILGDIERGGFEVSVQPSSFTPYLSQMELLINRVVIAVLAAALAITAALLIVATRGTPWEVPLGLLLLADLAGVGIFGMTAVTQLWRSRRPKS